MRPSSRLPLGGSGSCAAAAALSSAATMMPIRNPMNRMAIPLSRAMIFAERVEL